MLTARGCALPHGVRRSPTVLPRSLRPAIRGTRRFTKIAIKVMVPGRSAWSWEEPDAANSMWGNSATPAGSAAQLPISHQSLNMAFHVLDKDGDGLIGRTEAYRMVAFYLALQESKPADVVGCPLTWDQHLLASIAAANKLSGGRLAVTWEAMESFVAAKMAGGLQKQPPRCSDLVWSGLGMGVAMLALGLLAGAAKALPVVGTWHQHGLPLLLGSFGTIAILLFGKSEAEAVRLWPVVAGQLGATAIAVLMIQICGASLISRAAAMAATVMYMMYTDTVHPPGGALVLMAMDNAAIQQFQWAFMVWPSLLLCLGVLLPISAATNWLRRNKQFDWPTPSTASPPVVTLKQKQQEWDEQQQKRSMMLQRHAAVMLSDRVTLPLQQQLGERIRATFISLSVLAKMLAQKQKEQQQQQQCSGSSQSPGSSDTSCLGSFIRQAGAGESPATARLDAAVRRRMRREADRKLEDEWHRQHIWGREQLSGLEKYERKLQKLHEERLKNQRPGQQQFQPQQQQQHEQQPVVLPPQVLGVAGGKGEGLSTARAEEEQFELQQQQQLYPGAAVASQQRPAWMYRWRSDIATVPGVGDSFAPDEPPASK